MDLAEQVRFGQEWNGVDGKGHVKEGMRCNRLACLREGSRISLRECARGCEKISMKTRRGICS